MENNLNMFGRFRLFYDYDTNQYWFYTEWENSHKQKRTVTEEQAEVIKDIMMGGHIKVCP